MTDDNLVSKLSSMFKRLANRINGINRIFNYRRHVIDSYFNKNGELI